MGGMRQLHMDQKCTTGWMFVVAVVLTGATLAAGRTYVDLDPGWRFSKGDFATAAMPAFADSAWRTVNVPHDWSIEGPFGPEFGSGNGFAPGGIGWYRRHFTLDGAHKDKLIVVEFDGIYCNSEVWINGHFVGGRPYGYSSFECDLTPYVKFGEDENVLAVRVDHSRFADSRWYTGSGIYRHVRLRITDKLAIAQWGTFVTTPQVTEGSATVRVETTVNNAYDQAKDFSLQLDIIGSGGPADMVKASGTVGPGSSQTVVGQLSVKRPRLWSIDSPTLYTLKTRVRIGTEAIDVTETRFGIRTIRFDPDKGFFLNDKPMKLKGVCIHHDAGCLGAAVPDGILEWRLRRLQELGTNAIRTSHNPPAPELLDMCDRIGLLVMDEAFDEFTPAKNKWVTGRNVGLPSRFGYAENFAEWSVRDVEDLVRRDRNHPCVIMWSIGNEVDYANDPFSHPVLGREYRPENPPAGDMVEYARPLIAAVKKWDTTRPVTAALATVAMSNEVGLPESLDIVGYNYQESRYAEDHEKYPKRFIYGSENGDQYNNWLAVRDNEYISGQFLWTGIDYLGEANRWPNRANGAGLLDLCGFKKPDAWYRQSLWSDKPMVYICASPSRGGGRGRFRGFRGQERWNFTEGATMNIICYTNCPEVRLILNDKEVAAGRLAEAMNGAITWQVTYEPGVLKAVGLKDGKPASDFTLKTAGSAKKITLTVDPTGSRRPDNDIWHVEFEIVDDQGVRVPDAANEVTFDVEGPATILGIGNADLNSPDDCTDRVHKAYHGRGLLILRGDPRQGKITLTAQAEGLAPGTASIEAD